MNKMLKTIFSSKWRTYLFLCAAILILQLFPYLLIGEYYVYAFSIIYPEWFQALLDYLWHDYIPIFCASVISSSCLALLVMGLLFLFQFLARKIQSQQNQSDAVDKSPQVMNKKLKTIFSSKWRTYLFLCVAILILQLFPYLLIGKSYGMLHYFVIAPFLELIPWYSIYVFGFLQVISSCCLALLVMGLLFGFQFVAEKIKPQQKNHSDTDDK